MKHVYAVASEGMRNSKHCALTRIEVTKEGDRDIVEDVHI